MASPKWFFSTLAQSSAAIAGLVIAFSAVLYQLERQRIEKRTEELREELIVLKEDYQSVVTAMRGVFTGILDYSTLESYAQNITKDTESLKETLEQDDEIEYPHATLFCLHLYQIEMLLRKIEPSSKPESHYLLSVEEIDKFRHAVNWLAEHFQTPTGERIEYYPGYKGEIMELFTELESQQESERHFVYTDIFGTSTPSAKEGNQRKFATTEEVITATVKKWLDERSVVDVEEDPHLTGKNLYSFSRVIRSLRRDFQKIDTMTDNTILDYTTNVSLIIITSGGLIVVGVLIPMLFLFTLPQTLSGIEIAEWSLLIIQALLLILTGGITGYLLFLVHQNLGPATDRG